MSRQTPLSEYRAQRGDGLLAVGRDALASTLGDLVKRIGTKPYRNLVDAVIDDGLRELVRRSDAHPFSEPEDVGAEMRDVLTGLVDALQGVVPQSPAPELDAAVQRALAILADDTLRSAGSTTARW